MGAVHNGGHALFRVSAFSSNMTRGQLMLNIRPNYQIPVAADNLLKGILDQLSYLGGRAPICTHVRVAGP